MADSTAIFGAMGDIGLQSVGERSVPKTIGDPLKPSPPRRPIKARPFSFQ